jgi:hypothetical protein
MFYVYFNDRAILKKTDVPCYIIRIRMGGINKFSSLPLLEISLKLTTWFHFKLTTTFHFKLTTYFDVNLV